MAMPVVPVNLTIFPKNVERAVERKKDGKELMLLTILLSLFFLAKVKSPKISENKKLDDVCKVDTF